MGRKGILRGGRVRALAAVAALLALVLAWPAGAQVVCTGGGCGGGAVTSPVATDPISFTGAATFDNAANTPVTLSDGAAGGTLCSVGVADTANSVCVGSNAVTGEGATADANETVLAFGDASADNTLTLKGTALGVEATVTTGALLTGAGTGTGRVSVGGVICKGAAATATTGTSEEILATCTVPANTLSANGATIRVYFFAHTAANANNKRLIVRMGGIGGVVVSDSTSSALNNRNITTYGPVMITRTGATTAAVYGGIVHHGADSSTTAPTTLGGWSVRASAITWANSNDLVITGTTATSAGDLTLDAYTIEVLQ